MVGLLVRTGASCLLWERGYDQKHSDSFYFHDVSFFVLARRTRHSVRGLGPEGTLVVAICDLTTLSNLSTGYADGKFGVNKLTKKMWW